MNVKQDNEDAEKLVSAAKYAKWDDVFFILGKKPYLINCVPCGRAWATLHQAVYLEASSSISKLMTYSAFDALVKTYETTDGFVKPGSTALEIAKKGNDQSLYKILSDDVRKHRNRRFAAELSYVVSRKGGRKVRDKRIPAFILEVMLFKDSLLDSTDDVKTIMTNALKMNFGKENTSWSNIANGVHWALYAHCKKSAEAIHYVETDLQYFEGLIKLFTSNLIYREVNAEIVRDHQSWSKPNMSNLALGLYALLLDTIVSYWDGLASISTNTFRGIEGDVTSKFYVGDEVTATVMFSCSKSHSAADSFRCQTGRIGTMLVIDNSALTNMRPRYIANLSAFKSEEECVYPIGAEFRVTSINPVSQTVCLQLLK